MRNSLLLALLAAATLARAAESTAPPGPLPDTVVPVSYNLKLTIDPRQANFSGQARIEVKLRSSASTLWLHGLGLKVTKVTVLAGGATLAARYSEVDHDTGVARLDTDQPIPAGAAVLDFTYQAPFQDSAQGIYRAHVAQQWYAFTQFEAIDARRAFPSFDEPRFKTPYDITLTTAHGDLAVTNTPETRVVKGADGSLQYAFERTKPLPSYLVAFVVGPLQVLEGAPVPPNAVRKQPLPLRLIGTQGDPERFRFALEQAPQLITRLEEYFGIPFPYPKIDLIASPTHLGAMENAGAIIFAESLLAFPGSPTPRQQSDFGTVAAHELAHQWFGDLVTPAWWDDIWLNEAFAEWMGSKIADEWRPQLGVEQEQLGDTLDAMRTDALRAGRPIRQQVTRNDQISATFDNITYNKGAGVIGMVESYLGVERFQRGVRLHLSRHAYGTATAKEFFAAMAEGSGEPSVIDAFESFVTQPGVPVVKVSPLADGALALAQSRYHPLGSSTPGSQLWKIPFCVTLYQGGTGHKQCTMLTGASGTLAPPKELRGAVVHPNAAGAGYYRFHADAALMKPLLATAATLPPREALTLADNAAADFDAGTLSFAGLYQVAQVLARHPDRTSAFSLGERLQTLHDHTASAAERPLLEKALVQLYGERLRRLGYDPAPGRYAKDPAEQQLLRRQLIGLLGLTARDPEIRAALTPAAERATHDPGAIEPLLRWRAWAIALRERGAPLLAPLTELAVKNQDTQVRQDAALGLAFAPPALSPQVLDLTLKELSTEQSVRIVLAQFDDPASRPAAVAWLKTHEEAALARVPAMFQEFYAQTARGFCSSAERQQFAGGLGARLRKVNGGDIAVDRALEAIDDCIALRAALGDSISKTLGGAAAH